MNHPKIVAAAAKFTAVLVRVPEAYKLVLRYRATRPGFLFLDAAGKSRGSIGFSVSEKADDVAARAVDAMEKVLKGESLPGAGERGFVGVALDEAPLLPGVEKSPVRIVVKEVVADSPAAKAGLVAGDVLLAINGKKAYGTREEKKAVLEAWQSQLMADHEVQFVIERGADIIAVKLVAGRMPE